MAHNLLQPALAAPVMSRRSLIEAAGALLLLASESSAPNGDGPRAPIFQHDLPDLALNGWSVTAVEVLRRPGESSPAHRHPGLTIGYVLAGEMVMKIGDEPERTYKRGEMFIEMPNQLHAVSRNASGTQGARLLAILLAPKGATLTTPEK